MPKPSQSATLGLAIVCGLLLAACSAYDPLPPPVPTATTTATHKPSPTLTSTPTATPTPTPMCASVAIPEIMAQEANADGGELSHRPVIMTHFMAWYGAPPVTAKWGHHWTMNYYPTNIVQPDGTRAIASQHYPLTGPYDSSDADILEYQVLLMKLSGIDGVIVDWYGSRNHGGYAMVHRRTEAVFNEIQMAGLLFSLCYEDQTVGNLIRDDILIPSEAIGQGQEDMLTAESLWMGDDAYLKIDNQPVLLNFGPQYFRTNAEWAAVFSVLDVPPVFYTLDSRMVREAIGAFNWPPMHLSRDGVLSFNRLRGQLADYYGRAAWWGSYIASAFPGFHDIYAEAGVGAGFGYLDHDDGRTFGYTLEEAFRHEPDIIQLVTWNDYGEGTIIEPTIEFGYQYLEMVQEARRQWIDPDFPFSAEDLRLPLRLFELRKHPAQNDEISRLLDTTYGLIAAGELDAAESLLACVEARVPDLPLNN